MRVLTKQPKQDSSYRSVKGGIIFTVQGGLHVLETDHVGEAAELPVAYGLVMDSGWPFRPPPGSETNPDGEYRQNTYPLASVAYDDLLEEISASWGAPKKRRTLWTIRAPAPV
jgi:hypothetical protein